MNLSRSTSFVFMSLLGLSKVISAAPKTAQEIAEQSLATSKVSGSTSDSTFTLINASGQKRVRETTGKTKLVKGTMQNMRLVEFLSPSDVKGTKTLLIEHEDKDDDMWIYLPALKKVRRLVSSDKKSAFVGTDFSYGDVIGHRVKDWNHKILREEKLEGKNCWVLESEAKNSEVAENSGYSKRIGWIDQESFVALKGEGYDLNKKLFKKFKTSKIEKVDSKHWQPMEIEAENLDSKHRTIIEFKKFKVSEGVSDEEFTARYLEK